MVIRQQDSPLRIAICGLGTVANVVYFPLLERMRDRFDVVAVCDRDRRAREDGAQRLSLAPSACHATVQEVAARHDVDGVLLLTSGSHARASRVLLDAGKAVLVEKPLAYTRAGAESVADGADRILVGYMKLFDPAVEAAIAAIDQLGTLRAAEVTVLHPSPQRQLHHLGWTALEPIAEGAVGPPADDIDDVDRLRIDALGDEAAGALGRVYTDLLLGSVVHDLAVLRALVGDPQSIDHAERWEGPGGPSLAFDGRAGDVRVSLRWHYLPNYPSYREQVRVHGERGSLTLEFPAPYLLHAPTAFELSLPDGADERRTARASYGEAFARELDAFDQVARGRAAPRASVTEGRADIVTCQRIAAALAATHRIEVAGEAAKP